MILALSKNLTQQKKNKMGLVNLDKNTAILEKELFTPTPAMRIDILNS